MIFLYMSFIFETGGSAGPITNSSLYFCSFTFLINLTTDSVAISSSDSPEHCNKTDTMFATGGYPISFL